MRKDIILAHLNHTRVGLYLIGNNEVSTMRQAIQTKFIAPTNHRGSRVKAWADAGQLTVDWDHRLGIDGNHCAAARALAQKLKWIGVWSGGGLPDSGYAFVQASETDFVV